MQSIGIKIVFAKKHPRQDGIEKIQAVGDICL